MQRWAKITKAVRLAAALAIFAALTAVGYDRGYNAEDERAAQRAVLVAHKIDDLLGPDYSASGMLETTQSLIALVHSLHLEAARRVVAQNPVTANAGYSVLQVTTYPYLHKEIEGLFDQLRKPDSR
jgi:hypothetical protein